MISSPRLEELRDDYYETRKQFVALLDYLGLDICEIPPWKRYEVKKKELKK